MNTKNDVDVIINGKQYTISGYESSDYLQRIATHINEKSAEFQDNNGFFRLDAELRAVLLAINLTDDYYKAQEEALRLSQEAEDLEKEIFDMKHDIVELRKRLESRDKEIGKLREKRKETEHELIRLETELKRSTESAQKKPESAPEQSEAVPQTTQQQTEQDQESLLSQEYHHGEQMSFEPVQKADQSGNQKGKSHFNDGNHAGREKDRQNKKR